MNYEVIRRRNATYPPLLRHIHDPPEVLYLKGKLDKDDICIAVVGSRTPTYYGEKITKLFVNALVEAGATIVSGLAFGIDAIAHREALRAGGRTIAVLGFGIDQMYPEENRALASRIIQQGALITEFPPGTPAYPSHFPQRNRIISGLSHATLVIEAADKSGALITARLAFEQNRHVFAVPGQIDQPMNAGTNKLIQKSIAMLVAHPSEILEELKINIPQLPFHDLPRIKLSSLERKILNLLKKGPLTLDDILAQGNFQTTELLTYITELEMKGRIRNAGGRIWII